MVATAAVKNVRRKLNKMEFKELIKNRHSVRSYTSEKIPEDILKSLIQQAKLAPSSRNKKPCDFVLVTDRADLEKLSQAKAAGSQMIKDAAAAIIVTGDSSKSDVWIEDCSIAMTYLHLAAVDAGLGSVWVQLRNRKTADDRNSTDYVKKLFKIKPEYEVLAVLSLGYEK